MSLIHIEVSDVIDARPDEIYAVIVDYRVGHPAILPKPYFTELTVESGGHGEGTVANVKMQVMGVKQSYHLVITEPEPGRVMVERDDAAGVVTTFTIDPLNDGARARVTIASDMRLSPGLVGIMERLTIPPITRRIYLQELAQLADYVQRQQKIAAFDDDRKVAK